MLTGTRWQEVFRFADLVTRGAASHRDRDALVFPGERLTYAELEQRAFAAARALRASGIGPGDRVGLLMPNCTAFVELLFGISLLGAIMVPINARFAAPELRYVIENGDLQLLFTSDIAREHVDYVERLHEALPELAHRPPGAPSRLSSAPRLAEIVLIGSREAAGMVRYEQFGRRAQQVSEEEVLKLHARTCLRSVALMMYTSGTTAQPKGCMLSHESLVRPALISGREKFRLRDEDRFWDPLPMFHMSAILPLIGVLDAGASFISMSHFEAGQALQLIEAEQASVLYPSFPAVTQALLNHPSYHRDRWRHARVILNVAPPDTLRSMQEQMPHTVQISSYGCTECGGVVCFNDIEDSLTQRCTTSGTPFTGMEVEIRDLETGQPVQVGARGEILVRGYGVFDGYYRDPKRTAEVLDEQGWLHTGDVGCLDADGRVSYLGRTKDMLKVGGENVAALEIESHICAHPAVSIAAVVGVPDPKYMEVPAAFVELRRGQSLSERELIEHCERGLASFKVPRHVRFVTEWPMSATKIRKFELQQALARELEEGREAGLKAAASAERDGEDLSKSVPRDGEDLSKSVPRDGEDAGKDVQAEGEDAGRRA